MIPQNFKDILGNVEYAGTLQSIALIIFMLFFGFTLYYVMSKPKKYYDETANSPLDDNEIDNRSN